MYDLVSAMSSRGVNAFASKSDTTEYKYKYNTNRHICPPYLQFLLQIRYSNITNSFFVALLLSPCNNKIIHKKIGLESC